MTARRKASERGIVLIVVLWGVVLLTLLAFALSTSVRTGLEGIESQQEQLQAHYFARGAIYETLGRLLAPPPSSANHPSGEPPAPQTHFSWQAHGWRATVQIDDEAGKIDLNHAPREMLVRLFQALGVEQHSAEALADATEEWRAPDLNPGIDDAEDAYYRGLTLPYVPPHADFQSVAEMLQVRGVTSGLFYGRYLVLADGRIEHLPGLIDCLTVESKSLSIDINSAPYPVLLAIPDMDPQVAEYILQARAQRPFTSLDRLLEQYPGSLAPRTLATLTTSGSGRLSLLATATNAAGVTARVQALVLLQPAKAPPFLLLQWDDNYVR